MHSGRASDAGLAALGEAEDDAGIVVSAATPGDLWSASHKTGPNSLVPGGFESLRRTVLDPAANFEVVPVTVATMDHFMRVPLVELADPFDRFIPATAAQLGLPLVTADRAISRTGAVQVINERASAPPRSTGPVDAAGSGRRRRRGRTCLVPGAVEPPRPPG